MVCSGNTRVQRCTGKRSCYAFKCQRQLSFLVDASTAVYEQQQWNKSCVVFAVLPVCGQQCEQCGVIALHNRVVAWIGRSYV